MLLYHSLSTRSQFCYPTARLTSVFEGQCQKMIFLVRYGLTLELPCTWGRYSNQRYKDTLPCFAVVQVRCSKRNCPYSIPLCALDLSLLYCRFHQSIPLHHCVGQCKYYKKPNSLVLSARIDGERIETVELSLETFKVLQSRGICNGNSPYHDAIINLVQKNVGLVMERMTA